MRVYQISEKEKNLKDELKRFGEAARKKAEVSKGRIESAVEQIYETTEGKSKAGHIFPLIKKIVLIGVGVATVFVVYSYVTTPRYDRSVYDEMGGWEGAMGVQEMGLTVTPRYKYKRPAPTFKDRFLGALGQHEASPYEIAKKGPILEKDMNVEMMTTKEKVETENFVQSAFQLAGGYVTQINPCNYCGKRGSLQVYGKVSIGNLEGFRAMLKNFIGEDKYYREDVTAQSRTADIIEIEKKIKEVEKSISYLEGAISRETDPKKKAELEKKLIDNRAFFTEREGTKEAIEERVNFVDVSLSVTFLPTFLKASTFDDFKLLYLGFAQPSMFDKFKINTTRVLVILLQILSYTFWIIPIFVWLWWRKRRIKKMLEELE